MFNKLLKIFISFLLPGSLCCKQGINLAADGCKIAAIPVNLGNLDIRIATNK